MSRRVLIIHASDVDCTRFGDEERASRAHGRGLISDGVDRAAAESVDVHLRSVVAQPWFSERQVSFSGRTEIEV